MVEPFERFAAHVEMRRTQVNTAGLEALPPMLADLFASFGGTELDEGLYRIETPAGAATTSSLVAMMFPHAARYCTFGRDWMGRVLAVDVTGQQPATSDTAGDAGAADGDDLRAAAMVLFEPGTSRMLTAPVTFGDFHDHALISDGDEILNRALFDQWRADQTEPLGWDECVGFVRLPFTGGNIGPENLARTTFSTYWSVCAQMRHGTDEI